MKLPARRARRQDASSHATMAAAGASAGILKATPARLRPLGIGLWVSAGRPPDSGTCQVFRITKVRTPLADVDDRSSLRVASQNAWKSLIAPGSVASMVKVPPAGTSFNAFLARSTCKGQLSPFVSSFRSIVSAFIRPFPYGPSVAAILDKIDIGA